MTNAQAKTKLRQIHRHQIAHYRKYLRIWNGYYIAQGEIILNNLKEGKEDLIFNTFVQSDVEKIFIEMYETVGVAFAQETFVEIEISQKQDSPVQMTWEHWMQQYAITNGSESIVSISQTGREYAKRMINSLNAQAIEQGWSVDQLSDEIEKAVFDEWKITSKFSAERIARTEVIAASNAGAMLGAESITRTSGLVLKKVWLTALDGREREAHAQAHLQERMMNQPFNVGGDLMSAPGDKTASADNVVNCRCGVAYQSVIAHPLKN